MTGLLLQAERLKWRSIKWLIIDEISVVSYRTLRNIHLRLQEYKNNELLFGGVNVLLFGDLLQLPPVTSFGKQEYCFQQPEVYKHEIHLWRQFSFCELKVNMRQQGDMEFTDLLNSVHIGIATIDHIRLLEERRYLDNTEEFCDAIRVFATRKLVAKYNLQKSEELKQRTKVYKIVSLDKSVDGGQPVDVKYIPENGNKTAGLVSQIEIGVGSRVMLRRNINISKGLVNGSMGIISSIQWPALRDEQLYEGEMPELVRVKFDEIEEPVAIHPIAAQYDGIRGFGKIERKMMPLILCWAVTIHKLQGVTKDKAVVDLGKQIFAKGQAYVALSRVRAVKGLAVSDLHVDKILINPHDQVAFNELQRLREME